MKRTLLIIAAIVLVSIATIVIALYPRFRNMRSEYDTVSAIRALEDYIQKHEGQWPRSPDDLENAYPIGGAVTIDYTMTSDQLIEHPETLRDAVRPRSGKFYTYPRYAEHINSLLSVIRKTNNREQVSGGNRGGS